MYIYIYVCICVLHVYIIICDRRVMSGAGYVHICIYIYVCSKVQPCSRGPMFRLVLPGIKPGVGIVKFGSGAGCKS